MKSAHSVGTLAFLCLALAGSGSGADEYAFVGVRKCGSCHSKPLIGNQSGAWKRSAHARAYETLNTDRAHEVGRAAGVAAPPGESPDCLRCHVTGYGLSPKRFPRGRPLVKDGVGCESCHGAGHAYRKKKVMSDRDLAIEKGLKIPSEEDCRRCHNSESPTWDSKRYPRAGGSQVGFDFESAVSTIDHPIPPDVKGRYLEIKKKKEKEGE